MYYCTLVRITVMVSLCHSSLVLYHHFEWRFYVCALSQRSEILSLSTILAFCVAQEKKRLYDEQQSRMLTENTSFLDSIRAEYAWSPKTGRHGRLSTGTDSCIRAFAYRNIQRIYNIILKNPSSVSSKSEIKDRSTMLRKQRTVGILAVTATRKHGQIHASRGIGVTIWIENYTGYSSALLEVYSVAL